MRSHYLLAALIVAGLALVISLPILAGEAPSKEKIGKLIEQMGSDSFAQREKATKELEAIGVPALEALRTAAKSDDVEVRRRAEAIIPKIEIRAESERILAPKRVHLVYKDTPLNEAIADFQKKSGYTIHLHDPDGKLKSRKITLDTGETTFWHAAELFCDKGRLTEGTVLDLMPKARGLDVASFGGGIFQPAATEHLILKEGKRKKWPADDRGAIRIRAMGKSDMLGKAPQGEVVLALEISRESKLQWQLFLTIQIDKAVDNRGQKLTQVFPKTKEGITSGFGGFLLPAGVAIQEPFAFSGPVSIRQFGKCGGLSQQVPLQLRKGDKPAKSIVELKGFITAWVLAEGRRRTVNIPFVLKNVPLP